MKSRSSPFKNIDQGKLKAGVRKEELLFFKFLTTQIILDYVVF
jgi:hypothetical protein